MNRHEIGRFLDERRDAWRLRDPVMLARGHQDNGVVQSPIFGTIHGREAIETSYRELFRVFADWTIDEQDDVIEDGRAAQVLTVQGTHTGNLFGVPRAAAGLRFRACCFSSSRTGRSRESAGSTTSPACCCSWGC